MNSAREALNALQSVDLPTLHSQFKTLDVKKLNAVALNRA